MVLNKFFINILIRVTFIVISCVALGFIIQHLEGGYYYTLSGIVFLIVLQAWLLVNQVNKTNSDLEKFFSSVQDHDSSVRFPREPETNSFGKLHDSMNHLNAVIQKIKIEHERTSNFLQNLVDHVDIGLLSFDRSGKIDLVNKAAIRYIKVQQPRQLSSIEMKNVELYKILHSVKPGHEVLYKTTVDSFVHSVLIKTTEFRSDDNLIRLVSFQDITSELDKKELDSWQKLIRVLTHEIMNSISPITSLTAVISGYFRKKDDENPVAPEKVDRQIIAKTLSGLDTIEETGRGLLDFVDKFRSLTALPKPELCKFTVMDLLMKCKLLMESDISQNISITADADPEDIELIADYSQVEQVLINLVRNAADALSGVKKGLIQLKAFYSEEGTIIQVNDNGKGISGDIMEDIFIPFYTTREKGSGIGLSLSRQIMQNHQGTISVNSAPGKGSTFSLKFPGLKPAWNVN